MKKHILAFIAVLMIAMFIVGCGAPAPTDTSEPTQKKTTEEPKMAEPEPEPAMAEPEPAMAEPEQEPAKVPSKSVQKLLEAHSRVKSMYYMYQDPLNYPLEWPTRVKGNKVHIDLREMEEVSSDVWIDHVYMDTGTKKAEGYCEAGVYRCKDKNKAVDVRYQKYARKTPLDWIKEVTYAEDKGEETMQQRRVVKLVYTDEDGAEVSMWVDDYYGVPMEVWVKKDGDTKKFIYEDLGINGVEDTDLEHQFIR